MITLEDSLRALIVEVVREELARQQREIDDYLDPVTAGRLASVAPATIRRWIREARIPAHRAGNRVRVKRSDLERMLRAADPGRAETDAQIVQRVLRSIP